MTRSEANLQKFLRRSLGPVGGVTRLKLIQVASAGTGSGTLRDMIFEPNRSFDSAEIDLIVAEFLSDAQDDANNRRGVTSYCVVSHKGISVHERSPLFRLRSNESDMEHEDLGDTESPTKDGLLAQLMRHNEVLMRQNVQQAEIHNAQSSSIISRLLETNTRYEERHYENIVRTEELMNEKEARESAKLLLLASEKRKDQVMATFKPLVPLLIAKFKGTPASMKPELWKETIKSILSDITPEKMEIIANALGPHSMALAEIYMEAHKEEDTPDEQTNRPGEAH